MDQNTKLAFEYNMDEETVGRRRRRRSVRKRRRRNTASDAVKLQRAVKDILSSVSAEITDTCEALDKFTKLNVPCTKEELDGLARDLWDCHDSLTQIVNDLRDFAHMCAAPGEILQGIRDAKAQIHLLALHTEILGLQRPGLLQFVQDTETLGTEMDGHDASAKTVNEGLSKPEEEAGPCAEEAAE